MPLCRLCDEFRLLSAQPEDWKTPFNHYSKFKLLETSARLGCELCEVIRYDISLLDYEEIAKLYESEGHSGSSLDGINSSSRAWEGDSQITISYGENPVSKQIGYVRYEITFGLHVVRNSLHHRLHYENSDDKRNRSPEACMSLVMGWLETCSTHRECSKSISWSAPTRLVDVGDAALCGDVRLVESRQIEGETLRKFGARYTALSYCWGKSMPPNSMTASQNYTTSLKHISFDGLPRTLQDAISITRQLRIRYIWIDALCIIQDSPTDWQNESSTMSQVYSNAYLTIAAESSPYCTGGIFTAFNSQPVPQAKLNDLIVAPHFGDHEIFSRTFSTPLSRRAWAYQEQALSRRIVRFTQYTVRFECLQTLATFKYPQLRSWGTKGIDNVYRHGDNPDYDMRLFLLSESHFKRTKRSIYMPPMILKMLPRLAETKSTGNENADIYSIWRSAIQQYSSRAITHESDRLPAISGLAHIFRELTSSGYAAGIWVDDLVNGLLWARGKVYRSELLLKPSKSYIAPSWSWASASFTIQYTQRAEHDHKDKRYQQAEILSVGTSLKGTDPTGKVSAGSAKLVSWTQRLCYWVATQKKIPSWQVVYVYEDRDFVQEDIETMILAIKPWYYRLNDDSRLLSPFYDGILIRKANGKWIRVGAIYRLDASFMTQGIRKEFDLY